MNDGREPSPAPAAPETTPAAGPMLDIRVRWKAGQAALAAAGLLAVLALWRPLSTGAHPWVRLGITLALGCGVAGTAFLASLRRRGRPEQLAFYLFLALSLDGLGQMLRPFGWPIWPLMTLLVAAVAVAERLPIALAVAGLATLFALGDAAVTGFAEWKPAVAAAVGYGSLVLALDRGLAAEKRRLAVALADLARLSHGIDQLEDTDARQSASRPGPDTFTLRQVSEDARRARQGDRASELGETVLKLVRTARGALGAHALLYFDVDRGRELALLRACDGPGALVRDAAIPLTQDPFAFVLDRRQSFYATDYSRLLWNLPYYRGELRIGTLLAVPVRTADVISGVLVADQIEIQSFTGPESGLLDAFAELTADAILRARASQGREELGVEFEAVSFVSRTLATLTEQAAVRQVLLRSARELVSLEGGAVVVADEAQTRYVVENAHGWAQPFEGREVGQSERTWAAWVLRSAEHSFLLDDAARHELRMPFLVLDEGAGRSESLLAVPLRARNRALGALILTGRRGSFSAATQRVLEIIANQAAAALQTLQLLDRIKELAVRDGLTGLYNRRAFDELLAQAVARQGRQGGHLALLLLDIDHFKKLNDTFGHPAGDAALKNTTGVLTRHLRRGDQAARFGGEEFVVILPATDEPGALNFAERARDAIEKAQLVFEGARLSVSVSVGLSVWPADGEEADALVAAADRALYSAKQGGRNRVVAASGLARIEPSARAPEGKAG